MYPRNLSAYYLTSKIVLTFWEFIALARGTFLLAKFIPSLKNMTEYFDFKKEGKFFLGLRDFIYIFLAVDLWQEVSLIN